MPRVERRSIDQKTVTSTSAAKKTPKWQTLVSELGEMTADRLLALLPDEGDSIRALKVQVSRAAKAAGRADDILYGENTAGELEVWLREKPKQTRGPRKKKDAASSGDR